jgi:anti-sigma regulatory factor (Ser/Thr protein kinase)
VSELATNALLHARTTIVLAAHLDGEALVVEVGDEEIRGLDVGPHRGGDEYGRGLRIVGELADAWGVRENGHGKTVWFRRSLS